MTHCGRDGCPTGALLGFVLALAIASAPAPAAAQGTDVFEVRDVAVDVTAETAAQARDQAVAEGERIAFRRLIDRLTPSAPDRALPEVGRNEILALLGDMSVAEEKTSAVRYLARLVFRFKAGAVRRFLIERRVPFAETPSRPALVLPVYHAAGAVLLWDDPNPWREAWGRRPPRDGLVPLLVPLGDLADLASIGAEQAVAGDEQRLAAVAGRYGAGAALVASAGLRLDSVSARPALDVSVVRHDNGAAPDRALRRTVAAAEGENMEALMRRAVAEVTREIEDAWKRANLIEFGRQGVLAVTLRIEGLGDWLAARKRLEGIAVIRRANLVLLSRDEARINIHHFGDVEQLVVALRQADLELTLDGSDWILSLAGRHTAGSARAE